MSSKTRNPLFHRTVLASIVPLLALSGVNQSHAQMLEEVIVTATKRTESLQDVAIAVSVLQGNELVDSGIDSQRALAMMVPNVAVNVNANFIAPYIRGVGTQYANPGLEPSVATYFNDLYISRPSAGFMNFNDVERVEVLKGPQGTLYGRNTTGGAIRVITKDPTDEFEAQAALTAGNYSRIVADGFVSGPITDTISGRLAAQYEERDGWVDNVVGGEDMEDREVGFIHGKLLWDVSDKLRIKLDADYTDKEDREGVTFQPLYQGLPEQVGLAAGGVATNEYDEYSGNVQSSDDSDLSSRFDAYGSQLRIDYDFDSFTLTSITGYRYMRFRGVADLDATSANLFFANTIEDETEDFSQEIQLVSNSDGNWEWLLGMYYFNEDASDNFGLSGLFIDADVGFEGAFVGGDGDIDVESFAPYGQISYQINEHWEVLAGIRYTDETKEVSNDFYVATVNNKGYPNKPYIQVVPTPDQKFEYDDWTPKAQVTWRPNDDIMIYASYDEGVKSGGYNMPSPSPSPVTEVDNETIKSYELGWKTQFDRLRINGAIFHYDLSDLQLQVTDLGGGITSVTNAGDATVDGLEADLTFAATDSLELGAGIGYQDTEFDNYPNGQFNPPCAVAPEDAQCQALNGLGLATLAGELKGNNLPQAPEWSGYLRGTYTWAMGSSGDLSFTVLASYSDSFFWTSDNLYEEDSKWLSNANVAWTSSTGRYAISAYINNLTDEEYNTHQAPFSGSGGWKVPGPPQMYGARFAYNF
jgi:iron complex outermembrane recepter protein